jgi:hypothetical protein
MIAIGIALQVPTLCALMVLDQNPRGMYDPAGWQRVGLCMIVAVAGVVLIWAAVRRAKP